MTEIYYFSGTGNSFVVAKKLSELLEGNCIAISSVIDKNEISSSADRIGIVFPVYNHLFPYIVKRFVEKLKNFDNKYIFAVCTFGGSVGISLEKFNECLEEVELTLSSGFGIKMPYNYIFPQLKIKGFFSSFKLKETSGEEQKELFEKCEKKIEEISKVVKEKKTGILETDSVFIERTIDFLKLRNSLQRNAWLKIAGYTGKTDLSMLEAVQLLDYGFNVDDKCIGCGTCKRICPVNNIEIEESEPVWLHKCEQCFACLQWCPQNAIQFRKGTKDGKRYHHPDVKLTDIINRKEN